jgi:hypothetical protein
MSLLRIFFLLLICWIIFSALRSLVRARRQKTSGPHRFRADGEEMILDPQCHSYVPKSAAVLKSGQYFCSQECARLYLGR